MATIPRRYIDNYTRSLEELSAGAQEALAERLAQVDYSDMSRAADEIVGIMEETCSISADASAEIAAAFYNGMSQYQTGTPYEAAPVSAHLAEGTEKATRGIFQKAVDGDIPSMTTQLLERADYEVKRAAGQTVLDNSITDPRKPRYARVPSGIETCDFCIMLASRGFVYRSAASAGELNHYHAHCRCRIIPGFDDVKVEGYDPDYYYKLWKEDTVAGETTKSDEVPSSGRKAAGIDASADVYRNVSAEGRDIVDRALVDGDPLCNEVYKAHESEFRETGSAKKAHYVPSANRVYIDEAAIMGNRYIAPAETWFHEFGHALDHLGRPAGSRSDLYLSSLYRNAAGESFGDVLRREWAAIEARETVRLNELLRARVLSGDVNVAQLRMRGNITERTYRSYQNGNITIEQLATRAEVKAAAVRSDYAQQINGIDGSAAYQDIVEGVTGGAVPTRYGHGKSYWSTPGNLETEALAEMFCSDMANPVSQQMIRDNFPESYAMYREMLESMKGA